MDRRRFLELASSAGAASIAKPLLARDSRAAGHASNAEAARTPPTLVTALDGEWLIATDARNSGREQKWFLSPSPDAKSTRVPSIIQETFPAYHGVVWYWRKFEAPAHPYAEGRYLLRFNEVDYLADVWLNGDYLGGHEGADTPFVLDATKAIRPGQNSLAVRVLNPGDERIDGMVLAETPHLDKAVKYTNGNIYDYGGIIDSVDLILAPAVRITDLYIRPEWKTGVVSVRIAVLNSLARGGRVRARFAIAGATIEDAVAVDAVGVDAPPGETIINRDFKIANHQLWDVETPYLYSLSADLETEGVEGTHSAASNFGFRDFRIVNGYFRLNDRRILLRCTHTGNHTPFSINIPPPGYPDMLRRDLFYAKASGCNTIRFISGVAHPYQLDLCDELGLMVYQEPRGAWLLHDSPQMKRRYEISVREMILRDRSHPSLVIYGMLNETADGPVFREAVSALSLVRSLDDTRLVLLSSGRFDGHLEIGSVSNPGSQEWEPTWGQEAAGAGHVAMKYPSGLGSGDFHFYPRVPQTPEVNEMMRTLGHDSKPIFLSEYGIGSMMDVIHEARMYEQAGVRADAEDCVLMRSMADRFVADWKRFGMDAAYPFPETLLQESQKHMARHRLLGFNMIRSNPKFCGFNLTGMLDHGMTGEGVWRFWRDWKPGAFDAMQDGWAPVRWCLFVEPTHTYAGRPITLEAVMANEDALRPGDYAAQFRVWGAEGIAWERQSNIRVPVVPAGQDGPLVVPVLKEDVTISAPAGVYKFVPGIPYGISPPDASWEFHLSDAASLPHIRSSAATWGVPDIVLSWLRAHGVTTAPFSGRDTGGPRVILVGDVSGESSAAAWTKLAEEMYRGSTVIFLSPRAFLRDKAPAGWLPLVNKGRVYEFSDSLYHKECVAKKHRVFDGLQGNGILDWYYYGPVLPHYLFDGQDTPDETIAAAFATGYSTLGGYASGVLLGSYKFGAGKFIVNSFPILENIDTHPAADRLLLNLIGYAASPIGGSAAAPPEDFQTLLKAIGYVD